jgi:NADPH2 dehydrogenase
MLFDPLTLRDLTLPNRIAVSPMTQYSGEDGCAVPWHTMHIGSMAVSGAGLVIMEATAVESVGRTTPGCLGLYSDANEAALTRLVSDIRTYSSTKLAIQLVHAGRRGSVRKPWDADTTKLPLEEGGWPIYGSTDQPYRGDVHQPEALDTAGIARVLAAFASAAARADRSGFDLLELHGAHGYLMHTFFSPISNTRTDGYGGSQARRMRFPLEVAQTVRAAWPSGKPLGVRLPGSDFIDGGLTVDDAVALAQELKGIGIDYVVPSIGLLDSKFRAPKVTPGYMVPFAERIRRDTGLPVMATGMILTPNQADSLLMDGRADMVALGRAFLNDPRWAWHAANAMGATVDVPRQYERVLPKNWPGYATVRPEPATLQAMAAD